MTKHNDGGPAFPPADCGSDGMSLRDWFAGQALSGIIASVSNGQSTVPMGMTVLQYIAASAYEVAGAMLAERAKE